LAEIRDRSFIKWPSFSIRTPSAELELTFDDGELVSRVVGGFIFAVRNACMCIWAEIEDGKIRSFHCYRKAIPCVTCEIRPFYLFASRRKLRSTLFVLSFIRIFKTNNEKRRAVPENKNKIKFYDSKFFTIVDFS